MSGLPSVPQPALAFATVKRLVVVGLLLGLLNGATAAAALYAVWRSAGTQDFGWFAYAPQNEGATIDYYYGFPWEYVVVPAVLVALDVVFLPVAVRRGWLR